MQKFHEKFYENWKFGPVLRHSPLCAYLGTEYCMNFCPDWTVAADCAMELCLACPQQSICRCTANNLPRTVQLPFDFDLPSPNGTTYFISRVPASPTTTTLTWLLCDPRQKAVGTVAYFQTTYATHPHYYLYCDSLGIILCGPLPASQQG